MQNTGQEKFVERFEKAAMQYVILSKAKEGEVTKENLQQTFRGNLQMLSNHLDSCIRTLVSDGHLREIGGNKYTVTDDGREDVQKLQSLVVELPNIGGMGAQTPRGGMTQPQTGAGVGGSSAYGSSPQGQPGREQRR